jgi:F420H(2)-dependent quinone reductase
MRAARRSRSRGAASVSEKSIARSSAVSECKLSVVRPLIVRLATRYLGALHRVLYSASGGQIGSRIWGLEILLLTTTGRRSGRARTVPLCSLRDGQSFVVIASYGGLDCSPSWWLNLQHEPRAVVRLGRITHDVVAREAMPAERERLWAQLTARAPGYLDYQRRTTRRIPVVLLEPPG